MSSLCRRSFLAASVGGLTLMQHPTAPQAPFAPPGRSAAKRREEPAYRPSTLFLTWHRDPTTTMTVQWVAPQGETPDTTIHYRPIPSGFNTSLAAIIGSAQLSVFTGWTAQPTATKPYHPTSDLKVFRAELTGLMPDTDYDFRIGPNSATFRFKTMPVKATRAVQFVSGGDCGVNPHTIANNIQAARQDPAFAVIGGDLAYDNGTSVETNLAFLRNYSKHMIGRDGRLIPMIACLGNHEVNGGFGTKREKAPFFYALFDGLYPDTGYATLDFGDYLSLVLLDTGHTSKVDGDQTDWLDRELRARRDHPHVLVVNHVPAYPSARSMGTDKVAGTGADQRQHWVPLFEKYRVPVVLEHHDHTFKRTKALIHGLADGDGVVYLGDGSWGQIRPPQPAEKLHHLDRISQEYHLSLHRIQGQERYHLALDENGRVMDICRTAQRSSGAVAVGH